MPSDTQQPGPGPKDASRQAAGYSGRVKIIVCDRLTDDWKNLADYLEIPVADQRRFETGHEARRIWEWLEARGKLGRLEAALSQIGRDDLVEELKNPR